MVCESRDTREFERMCRTETETATKRQRPSSGRSCNGDRLKTKIQAFNDILDAAVLSVSVCGEDVELVERFTYLGSDIHVSAGCDSEVNRRLGRAWGVMDSMDHGAWRCRYLCGRTKV